MKILRTHSEVLSAVSMIIKSYGDNVVIHGTPRPVETGDVLIPSVSKGPMATPTGAWVDLNLFPPYVFATHLGCVDLAIFYATLKAYGVPFTCGARAEVRPRIVFMANDEVKDWAKHANPTGRLCFLLRDGFRESPHGNWAELVSEAPVRILRTYAVHYGALSFDINDLPPPAVPGHSADELAALSARAGASGGFAFASR
jgi:hypothetical protein